MVQKILPRFTSPRKEILWNQSAIGVNNKGIEAQKLIAPTSAWAVDTSIGGEEQGGKKKWRKKNKKGTGSGPLTQRT